MYFIQVGTARETMAVRRYRRINGYDTIHDKLPYGWPETHCCHTDGRGSQAVSLDQGGV